MCNKTDVFDVVVIAVLFVNFSKAFDCVSHPILLHRLSFQFGIQGNPLSWLTPDCIPSGRVRKMQPWWITIPPETGNCKEPGHFRYKKSSGQRY